MSEMLTDPLDFASKLSEELRAAAVVEVQLKAAPKQVQNKDGTWPSTECEECGEPIPPERLEAVGAVTCIGCETLKEQKGRQYVRR